MNAIKDKLAEIDRLIGTSNFVAAKAQIDKLLKFVPGPEIPEKQPKSGEVYWRKLLIEVGCKSDAELLIKGKPLKHYSAFTNADKYANDAEKPVFISIAEKKNAILVELKKVLKAREAKEKRETGAEKLLEEYKKELNERIKFAQVNISELENVEKAIHEHVIDYAIVLGEHVHFTNNICSKAKIVGNNTRGDISREERDTWIEQLNACLAFSNHEINNFEQIKSNNEHYFEYLRLIETQKNIVSKIKTENISEIKKLQSKIENALAKIKQISDKYDGTMQALELGNYEPAQELVGQSCFEDIIKQYSEGR